MGVIKIIPLLVFCVLLLFVNPNPSYAQLTFSTDESEDYLIIGNKMVAQALTGGSGKEIGSNNAPVPATGLNGCTPTLKNTVPDLPFVGDGLLDIDIIPVSTGPTNDGNIAITDPDGQFSLAGYGVFGDIGIKVANLNFAAADAGSSLSFFNTTNYPNSLLPGPPPFFCPLTVPPFTFLPNGGVIPTFGVSSDPPSMAALTTELGNAMTAIEAASLQQVSWILQVLSE